MSFVPALYAMPLDKKRVALSNDELYVLRFASRCSDDIDVKWERPISTLIQVNGFHIGHADRMAWANRAKGVPLPNLTVFGFPLKGRDQPREGAMDWIVMLLLAIEWVWSVLPIIVAIVVFLAMIALVRVHLVRR
jgi:hypothetical protein